jgi:vacuolar protein sorting-associated protein 13A/C
MHGTSSGSHKLWYCVSIQATEIAKDIHSDAIQDWCLVVKSPLTISNFLPLAAEYSVLEMQSSGHFLTCSRGVFLSGKTVQIHSADIRKPLFLSLLPQRGWLPVHVRYGPVNAFFVLNTWSFFCHVTPLIPHPFVWTGSCSYISSSRESIKNN